MMTAKIHAKDGDWSRAKQVLASNSTKVPGDQAVNDILYVRGDGFACTCEGSLLESGTPDMLAPSSSKFPQLNVLSTSPRRAFVLHAGCSLFKARHSKEGRALV
jgi:DnaJ family protein C protein 3